ncbi:hypothetical protein [Kitasatospora griseola]|uniref:hypothetical protein n=1 Tax=Kitasatospora griseola TaxID=2064 RepID=UPI00198D3205|nr:hypothetical protein [Kitasatospora griseola]GGQ88901.1 hypothetical protein GCM10010195_50770 [Kitasatospora griseola]
MRLFAIRDYRHLFAAQVIALFGTGLTTVALGLLAYDLAGPRAGTVLGTALTIKMVMYVVIAPLAAAVHRPAPQTSPARRARRDPRLGRPPAAAGQ